MNKPYVIKKRRLFKPDSSAPFTISCTQIEAFVDCPRCFYINHRLGIRRSSSPPFTLNLLVDRMLNRGDRTPHPFVRAAR